MTEQTGKPTAMETLISTLDIEPIEVDIFRGRSPQVGWQRVFGGQVIAQALMAAQRTVDIERLVHSLHAHGTSIFDQNLQVASLDHAMWFHRPDKLDDWLLYTQDSPSASGARGLTRGSLFTRSGVLIASVAQEGLIRKKANE